MKPEKSFVRQQSKERKDTLFIGSQDCSDYSGALSIYNASSMLVAGATQSHGLVRECNQRC